MPIQPGWPRSWPALRRALAAATFAAAAVLAQEPEVAAPFAERVEVEVVNVDVVVTDRDGRRVTDLGRDDFELRVDGHPVAIEYFGVPSLTARPSVPAPPAAPGLEPQTVAPLLPPAEAPTVPALLVIFVDQSALERRVRRDTLAELREFVAARGDDERVMVAAFEDHLRLFAAPTSDGAEIETALAALEALPSHAGTVRAERTRLEHEVREFGRAAPLVRSVNDAEGFESNQMRVARRQETENTRIKAEIELFAEQELDRQSRSVRAMSEIVAALGALPGRKAAVLATAGFSSQPGSFLLRFLARKREYDSSLSSIPKVQRLEELGMRLNFDFEELVEIAQNARVAFYTVAAPPEPPSPNSAEFESAGRDQALPPPRDFTTVDQASSVTRLAAATGGKLFLLGPDLDAKLGEVRDDTGAVYSLGFTTGAAAGDKDHSIEVAVLRPGLEVRHRESFRRRSAEERQDEALMAAATLGETANGAGLRLEQGTPAPAEKGETARLVPIALRIPIASLALAAVGPLHQGRIRVWIGVHAGNGLVTTDAGTPVEIAIPDGDFERALSEVWVHRTELRLEPGRHRVAALVADEGAGTFATVAMEIEIGEL